MSKGICVAGNMIVDTVYFTKGWPKQGTLSHIRGGTDRTTGGAVCNTIIDLAKLAPTMPLYAMGRIGEDADGDLILQKLGEHKNIDVSKVIREGKSAFTMVMQDTISNERTFFTCMSANERFCEDDIDFEKLDCDIFHIGYVLLLDALDQPDAEYGSKMARLLHDVQQRGIRTSLDVVSEDSDRFRTLVPPALRYADYCIINEIEAGGATGIPLRDADDKLLVENIPKALKRMKEMGVSTWAVIHTPEGGYGLDERDNYVSLDSLRLPEGYIQGSVGAGDAFCAGVLCAAERGEDLRTAIELGIGSAAASLSEPGSTEGMRSEAEVRELYRRLR